MAKRCLMASARSARRDSVPDRSDRNKSAPFAASEMAVAAPTPPAAPVTMQDRPFRFVVAIDMSRRPQSHSDAYEIFAKTVAIEKTAEGARCLVQTVMDYLRKDQFAF